MYSNYMVRVRGSNGFLESKHLTGSPRAAYAKGVALRIRQEKYQGDEVNAEEQAHQQDDEASGADVNETLLKLSKSVDLLTNVVDRHTDVLEFHQKQIGGVNKRLDELDARIKKLEPKPPEKNK